MRHSRVQTNGKKKKIEIEGMKIEEVNSVKYLGTIMNADNFIVEEIKERIAAGNRSFFANKKILQSKLITRKNQRKAVSHGNRTSSSIWIRMLGINGKY